MEFPDSNTVSLKYKFREFRGTVANFSLWEALIETRCQEFELASGVPLQSLNTTKHPFSPISGSRWITPETIRVAEFDLNPKVQFVPCEAPRDGTVQMCESIVYLLCARALDDLGTGN